MVLDKLFFSTQNQNQLKIFNNSEKNEILFAKVIKINNTYYFANGLYEGFKLWSIMVKDFIFKFQHRLY